MKISISLKANQIEKAVIKQDGTHFETGKPVTFKYVHNLTSATQLFGKPKKTSEYGRWFEPSGQYVNAVPRFPEPRPELEFGTLTFNNPLVIKNNDLGWKQQLSESFGNKRGKALSEALIRSGYDGIVTVDKYGTTEIVNLTNFKPNKALYGVRNEN
jgi:hypothetical protein